MHDLEPLGNRERGEAAGGAEDVEPVAAVAQQPTGVLDKRPVIGLQRFIDRRRNGRYDAANPSGRSIHHDHFLELAEAAVAGDGIRAGRDGVDVVPLILHRALRLA